MEHEEKVINKPKSEDEILRECYNITNMEIESMQEDDLVKAKKCKDMLNEYLSRISSKTYGDLLTEYRREKFGELLRAKEDVEKRKNEWNQSLSGFYKLENAQDRDLFTGIIRKMTRSTEKSKEQITDIEIESR